MVLFCFVCFFVVVFFGGGTLHGYTLVGSYKVSCSLALGDLTVSSSYWRVEHGGICAPVQPLAAPPPHPSTCPYQFVLRTYSARMLAPQPHTFCSPPHIYLATNLYPPPPPPRLFVHKINGEGCTSQEPRDPTYSQHIYPPLNISSCPQLTFTQLNNPASTTDKT